VWAGAFAALLWVFSLMALWRLWGAAASSDPVPLRAASTIHHNDEGSRAPDSVATSAATPDPSRPFVPVLLSRDCDVTASVRGNLGPPSVVANEQASTFSLAHYNDDFS
jgi:hypothetical protein